MGNPSVNLKQEMKMPIIYNKGDGEKWIYRIYKNS